MIDRIPPQNINAEQIVLGTMLKDSRCVEMCMASLTKDDFYRESHRLIFDCVITNRKQPKTVADVACALIERNLLEDVGGMPYLKALVECATTDRKVFENAIMDIRAKAQTRFIFVVLLESIAYMTSELSKEVKSRK